MVIDLFTKQNHVGLPFDQTEAKSLIAHILALNINQSEINYQERWMVHEVVKFIENNTIAPEVHKTKPKTLKG
jgi:hypothetical protein